MMLLSKVPLATLSLVILFLSSCCLSQNLTDVDFTSTISPDDDTPIVTINGEFFDQLVALLPDDYEIVNDANTWNFSEIFSILNESLPNIFFTLPTSIIIQFPELMLEWLGEEHPTIIAHHKLCEYLNNTNQILLNCTTNNTVLSDCPEPFIATNRYSVFFKGCNLKCDYANLLWGMSDEVYNRLTIVRFISLSVAIPALMIVLFNQYMDSKHSKEWFCQRPFITQSTFFIVICFVGVFIQWIVVPIIGESRILCQEELNGKRGVSFGNPRAGWSPCVISGLFFFWAVNSLVLYVVGFTLSLWKQFYAPLRSVWAQAGCAQFCDTICFETYRKKTTQMVVSKTSVSMGNNSTTINSDNDNDLYNGESSGTDSRTNSKKFSISANMDNIQNQWKRSDCGRTYCGLCCINCVCSSNFKYHILIIVFNIILCVAVMSENIMDAFHPMGICYAGGTDEWKSWWYAVAPLFFSTVILLLFVPAAIYLLCKTRKNVASKSAKDTLNHLGFRLAFYYFGILFAMAMIVFMSWRNNSIRGPLTTASETRIQCVTFGGNFDDCINSDEYSIPEYSFWLLYIAVMIAPFSTVVVTMHAKQIQRWIKMCPCLKNILVSCDKLCDCCDKDHTLMKIIDGTYFKNNNNNNSNNSENTRTNTRTNRSKNNSSKGSSKQSSKGSRGNNNLNDQPSTPNIDESNDNSKDVSKDVTEMTEIDSSVIDPKRRINQSDNGIDLRIQTMTSTRRESASNAPIATLTTYESITIDGRDNEIDSKNYKFSGIEAGKNGAENGTETGPDTAPDTENEENDMYRDALSQINKDDGYIE